MNSDLTKCSVEGVIIIADSYPPENIIQKILDVEILSAPDVYACDIKGYPWKFETKYYTAEINLYPVDKSMTLEEVFADTIKAIILYFDGTKVSSFDNVQKQMLLLENVKPEVQLIVCNNLSDESGDTEMQRKNILNWCVRNQFELVELDPLEENDEEEVIPEAKGYARVVQALQSHAWSNLVMKEHGSKKKPVHAENVVEKSIPVKECALTHEKKEQKESSEIRADTSCHSSAKNPDSKDKKVKVDGLTLEENWLNNVVSGEDPNGESFEALFSKFASMKDRAEGLTGDERKKYAEEVAIAFWRAMGGDEDEIDGLDD